ncbi:unnamed protein product [Paramecium octaurelia]|uniref:Uncharacterized protein n=1 Tax=Paramecium octaurelia TaxID=43137 RepID=A0A8S1XA07_PAROT|nr:unnamed protein product [Paramecium octaurelia]
MIFPKKEITADVFSDERTEEMECSIWNANFRQFVKTNFLIIFNKYLELICKTINGQILGIDQIQDFQENPKTIINLEKIQHLRWFGQYGQNNKKIGNWSARWKGLILEEVGGNYSELGLKQGLWKEPIPCYCSHGQVYEVGEYLDDQKIGLWRSIFEDEVIGYGQYDKQSNKIGKWTEITNNFWELNQVTFCGEYQNGKKIGKWDTYLRIKGQDQLFEHLGGGSYDENGDGQKIGMWIELSDEFYEDNQVSFKGEYQKDAKIGRWNTYLKFDGNNEVIGGGVYDQQERNQKVGKWIELCEGFNEKSQIIIEGEYRKGVKVGRWNTYFKFNGKNEQIGGGIYDWRENGQKIGKWIELSYETFRSRYIQVIYSGEYINGLKVGQWNAHFRDRVLNKEFKLIGGGQYDEESPDVKVGKWVELSKNFGDGLGQSQIIYIGEYKSGQKFGLWDIFWEVDLKRKKREWLGGGLYDGFGRKVGIWVEVCDWFYDWKQVKYQGEYKDGKKIKFWYNYWRERGENKVFEKIGGGSYDENVEGQKNGQWIDLSEDFYDRNQYIYDGSYNNGRKVGIWYEMKRFWKSGFLKTQAQLWE